MWRDTLIILAFVLATLTYFGITPRRISSYARRTKVEITKRGLFQRAYLLFVIVVSIVLSISIIFAIIVRPEGMRIDVLLNSILILILLWGVFLRDIWKISERGSRILYLAILSLISPLAIAAVVLVDIPLWEKIFYPILGVCIGVCVALTRHHINRKTKRKQSSE
jgi:hypothetical protein